MREPLLDFGDRKVRFSEATVQELKNVTYGFIELAPDVKDLDFLVCYARQLLKERGH